MDRKPYVAFYAHRPYRVMPDETPEVLFDYAVRSRVRYLVLDESVLRVMRPQLLSFMQDQHAVTNEPRLDAIYFGGHFKGRTIAIFRVLQGNEQKSDAPPVVNFKWARYGGRAIRGGPALR